MDQLFVDTVDFKLPVAVARNLTATKRTVAEALRDACELIGIELIDYHVGHFVTMPRATMTDVVLRSKAWCERARR